MTPRKEVLFLEIFREILKILDIQMDVPRLYGWYHILCLILTAGLTVFAIRRGRHQDEKTIRRVVFWTAVVVALLEVYKQINFSFGDGSAAAEYQWYAFPWQFCSTPMYIGLLTGLFRQGKIHRALCSYLATYCIFAGAAVMLYPVTVFIGTVGINIQTMVCHGSMVVIGGYLLGSGYVRMEPRTLLRAVPVFAICVTLAGILNQLAHMGGIENFNMFFISPYVECELPVYSLVHDVLPFPLNWIVYVLGFTVAAGAMLMIAGGIARLCRRKTAAAL